ncbi:hypothetical protein F5Y16DRAFT_1961 [Xylariaceae sp. FL0255]|nr:hypothetical protein F5Y16DRAFT_1961 [Xylariaceae sp. FL0255]
MSVILGVKAVTIHLLSLTMDLPPNLPPDVDRSQAVMLVWWIELGIGTAFTFLRFWARWTRRSLGVDDMLMGFVWLIFIGDAIAGKHSTCPS